MLKNKIYIIITIICLIVFGFWYTNRNKSVESFSFNPEPTASSDETVPEEHAEPKAIKVHITGAVNNPGVYELLEGDRIDDAVTLAGGLTEDADPDSINLSEFVHDAQKVRVPIEGETPPAVVSNTVMISDGLIDINHASEKELTALPGIGEVRAADIVKYREKNGGFKSVEEIKNITGIKDKTFDKIKDLITVR